MTTFTLTWISLLLVSLAARGAGAVGPRWRRGSADAHRERCAELAAPLRLHNARRAPAHGATLLQLRLRPLCPGGPRGQVFPGKPLFSFVRGVYRCCKEGLTCSSVKGIQGRMRGDSQVEFVLTKDISSLALLRAELHLHISNRRHLDVVPLIPFMAKQNLPTSVDSLGGTTEVKVDVLFPFQHLQGAAGGAAGGHSLINMRRLLSGVEPPGGTSSVGVRRDTDAAPVLDLGLFLSCSQAGSAVPCESAGVQLTHAPFVALYST